MANLSHVGPRPSMRSSDTRFPPESMTATVMVPRSSAALTFAASMIARASRKVMVGSKRRLGCSLVCSATLAGAWLGRAGPCRDQYQRQCDHARLQRRDDCPGALAHARLLVRPTPQSVYP